ncbi:piwi domain-containing protein [Rhizophagus clarus]|uniref:Piwi domain-containing protein n=1 Tax=Rhizophagus clarus TaxID=94130 RepID=A0A8H3MB08_9GLOM|nr:piwi domain-containing protein [Rhizophagus clarus]
MSTDTNNTFSIEKYVYENDISCLRYDLFFDIEEMDGSSVNNKVYKAIWNNTYVTLKSFNTDNVTITKEIVREILIHRKLLTNDYIKYYGITISPDSNKCLLVMDYAEGGTLRNYLNEKFSSMDWQSKCEFAFEIIMAIKSMHEEGIVHEDLNSNNILVHHDSIKISDIGLSRRFKDTSSYDTLPYDAPEGFFNIVNEKLHLSEQIEKLKKCNVYSVGVLLWEMSSGKKPFSDREYNTDLAKEIAQGLRESKVEGIPEEYFDICTKSWNGDPDMRPTIQEVYILITRYFSHLLIKELKLDHGLFMDGNSMKLGEQPVVRIESLELENARSYREYEDIRPSVYISINDGNTKSFNEAIKPSELCIDLPTSDYTYSINDVGSLKSSNIEKDTYNHMLFAKQFTVGQKLFIDDLSSYTPKQINTFKLLLIWALDSAKSIIKGQFSDYFFLNFFPNIRTLNGKKLNNPEELIRWMNDLYGGEDIEAIYYDDFVPLSESDLDISTFTNSKQPGIVNFKEKMSLEMWIGNSLCSNLIRWVMKFHFLQGLIIKKDFCKGIILEFSDRTALNFVNVPDIEIINKSYVEIIIPKTSLEDLFINRNMYSVKDVQSFQFAKDIITPEDVFNVGYLGYLMVKCEQYVITLNVTKLSKEFKQAAENAIESMNPITDLQNLFDEYGQAFPTRIVLGKLYRFPLRIYNLAKNSSSLTRKEELGETPFESLKPYLDCFDVTHFFKDDDGKVTTIEAECLQNLSNYTDDNLGIVEFDNVISTHHLLDMEQQNKIDTILNVKDNYKIIMTGIDDLKELEITKNNRYRKEIYTKVVFEETNFKFFGTIISKDNSKVEDYFVIFFMNSRNGFFVSITPLSESSIDIRECYVLWMIVGIPSKVNVFSPRNRELHVNYTIKEQITFRLDDDDSYYPIKTLFQLTKGDTIFVNTYFPVIGYGLKFVNWSKDFIYLQLFKDHIASEDYYDNRTLIINVHICVMPSDHKVLKLDNSNEEYCVDLIGCTLSDENFIREDAQQEVINFVKRPSLGRQGREICVRANFFEITKLPKADIYQYDLSITPNVPYSLTREIFQKFEDLFRSKLRNTSLVFDGRKYIFSRNPLPFDNSAIFDITLPEDENSTLKQRTFKIKLKKVSKINMDELQRFLIGKVKRTPRVLKAITVLNSIIKHQTSMKYVPSGKSFYTRNGFKSLTGIAEAWQGYYQSARPTPGKMMINIDLNAAVFCESGPLVNIVVKLLGKRSPNDLRGGINERDRNILEKVLKNYQIRVIHRKTSQHYHILKITPQDAHGTKFNVDGHMIGVASYFQEKYKRLDYPYLPCVMVEEEVFLPMEICEIIENQRYFRKLNDRQNSEIIKFTCQPPYLRENKIKTGIKELDYGSKHMAQFDMKVSHEMAIVKARILPTPTINYHSSSKEASFIPKGGVWNLKDKKLAIGATLRSWSVLVFGPDNDQSVERFVRELINTCSNVGMNISNKKPPIMHANTQGNVEESLKQAWIRAGNAANSKPQLVVCVLPNTSSQLYGTIKYVGDTTIGVVTQCIQSKYLLQAKDQYFSNVSLKINTKLGGTNSFLTLKQNPFLNEKVSILMGADVIHPGVSENYCPSIAALCASINPGASRYAASIRLQHGTCRRKPERILFYRDGVSENQFKQVLKSEVKAIKSACHSLEQGYSPKVTFVIVQKRHHTRFFPVDIKDSDRTGNCLPGTLIETGVTHPAEFDFYLQSHAGLQGTCRPIHYHVSHDENRFTSDSLQTLSYNLCYIYARCTRAVSIVPPIYYAHLACKRARFHIRDNFSESSSTTEENTQMTFGTTKSELLNVMYFI